MSKRKKAQSKQQRERRERAERRLDIQLNGKIKGDILIDDHLAALPEGMTIAAFVREALLEKIVADKRKVDIERTMQDMQTELADVKAILTEFTQRGITIEMGQAAQVKISPPVQSETPVVIQSSGLDMSRPRECKPLKRGPVVEEVTEEFNAIALGKLMSRSIKNAQPGRRK